MKSLTHYIKEKRRGMKISQKDMADHLGWSRQRYNTFESGKGPVKLHELETIFTKLDIKMMVGGVVL